jgi:hypothetical protein
MGVDRGGPTNMSVGGGKLATMSMGGVGQQMQADMVGRPGQPEQAFIMYFITH